MRSRLFIFFLLLGTAFPLAAQFTPQGFNYQSIVRDAGGNPVVNQTVVLLFSIRSGAPNGPVAYSEKQTISTNEFGLVNLVVGQGSPLQGSFGAINWGGGSKYLSVALETAPNVFDELGTSQLMSVPYALYAQNGGGSGGNDNWGTQTAAVGNALTGNGTSANPLNIAQQGASTGQVLKWDGSKWIPQDDIANSGSGGGTVTQVNTGAGLTGGPITTSGTVSLSNTGVAPGIYGSATEIPVITVDAQGRVTDVFKTIVQPGTVGITGGPGIDVQQNGFNFVINNTGDPNAADDLTSASTADGDVSGPFSNLQIKANAVGSNEIANNAVTEAKIANSAVTGAKLDDMNATSGQVLKWNGVLWAPAADAGISTVGLTAGTGISVTGNSPNFTIANTGDPNAADDLTTGSTANGDVSGPFSNLQIKADVVTSGELADNAVETANIANQAVTGAKIDKMNATTGQVLKWNGTVWTPQADATGTTTVLPGPGIDVVPSGNTFTVVNIGDLDPFDDLTGTSQAGGDLSGTFSSLQLKPLVVTNVELANNSVGTTNIINGSITGNKLNNMSAGTGQVLKWNGTAWAPANDNSGADNWGSQVALTDATLSGDGTNANPLKIAAQNATNGQVLRFNGSNWAPATVNLSGDNWGSQTAVTGAALTGNGTNASPLNLAGQGAANGQVLQWNGTAWVPATIAGDNWGSQTVVTSTVLAGSGTNASPLTLAAQGAVAGKVLKFNGTGWVPGNDEGDNWGSQAVWTAPALTGNGTFADPIDLDPQGATAGQVLKFNGTSWIPGNDASGGTGDTYNAGTGISIAGAAPNFIINNTGDLSNTNEIQTLSLVGSQLSLSSGGGSVNLPAANNYAAGTGISITGAAPNFTINNTGDADSNPANELQTISIAGNQVTLSQGGGTIDLPAANNYTAGAGISISGAAPNFTINNTGDTDNDPANELQNLSLNGAVLTISGTNSSVDLSSIASGGADNWKLDNNQIYNTNPENVLIGTNVSASGKLQVVAAGTEPAIVGQNGGAGAGALFTSNSGPALITKEGNVGIHVNSPSYRLDVDGDGHFVSALPTPQLTVEQAGTDYARILLKNSGVGGWAVAGRGGASPLFTIDFSVSAINPVFSATSTGFVGINGVNGGSAALKIFQKDQGLNIQNPANGHNWGFAVNDAGNLVLFNNQLGVIPAGTFNAASGFYTPSDRRLKKEIAAIPMGVLQKFMQLQPVSYLYKAEKESATRSLGFLAQDVQQLFPELVGTSPTSTGETYLSLNYAGFGILAVKAIQEQQQQIETLREENESLRKRLDAIEARLKN